MLQSEVTFPVRYYETDQMGVVHHSNYIRYFECARNFLMAEGGYPIERCEADGVTIPVVSVQCRYHYPARMGDVLRVTAAIEKVPLAKLVVRQAVYNQDGVLCADGEVTLGFLGRESGRPVRCPERLKELIENQLNK
jgi:acyl-CoA thioester hydrolase